MHSGIDRRMYGMNRQRLIREKGRGRIVGAGWKVEKKKGKKGFVLVIIFVRVRSGTVWRAKSILVCLFVAWLMSLFVSKEGRKKEDVSS